MPARILHTELLQAQKTAAEKHDQRQRALGRKRRDRCPKTKITKQESLPQFLHHGDTGRDEGQYQSPSGKEGGKAAIVSDALVCSLFTQSEIRTLWRKKIVIGVWVFDVHVVGTPVCRITTNNAGMPSTHQCLDRHSCATCGRLHSLCRPANNVMLKWRANGSSPEFFIAYAAAQQGCVLATVLTAFHSRWPLCQASFQQAHIIRSFACLCKQPAVILDLLLIMFMVRVAVYRPELRVPNIRQRL